jgi:hypothetical protein
LTNYNIHPETTILWYPIQDIFDGMKQKLTDRQIYYALIIRGIVSKVEKGYRQTFYPLNMVRVDGIIPHLQIDDNFHLFLTSFPKRQMVNAFLIICSTGGVVAKFFSLVFQKTFNPYADRHPPAEARIRTNIEANEKLVSMLIHYSRAGES